ncbi:copper-binding protein [Chitinimonas naiadis]
MHKTLIQLAVLGCLGSTVTVHATTHATTAASQETLTEGEIRKIDLAQKKVTIKHGEIKHLDMPPMTMVFRVKDSALLSALKPGDKVAFWVEMQQEGMTITRLEVRP